MSNVHRWPILFIEDGSNLDAAGDQQDDDNVVINGCQGKNVYK